MARKWEFTGFERWAMSYAGCCKSPEDIPLGAWVWAGETPPLFVNQTIGPYRPAVQLTAALYFVIVLRWEGFLRKKPPITLYKEGWDWVVTTNLRNATKELSPRVVRGNGSAIWLRARS